MKVYKVVAMVIDYEDDGEEETVKIINYERYPNHWSGPKVVSIESREVDLCDGHPLKNDALWVDAFKKLFSEKE